MATQQSRMLLHYSPSLPDEAIGQPHSERKSRLYAALSKLNATSHPSIQTLLETLDEVSPESPTFSAQGSATLETPKEQALLHDALLAKLTMGAYAYTNGRLLDEALEAENESEWWGTIERNRWRTAYYLLQSACLKS